MVVPHERHRSWLTRRPDIERRGDARCDSDCLGRDGRCGICSTVGQVQISGDVQQVVLEAIATVGILRLFDFQSTPRPRFCLGAADAPGDDDGYLHGAGLFAILYAGRGKGSAS